MASCDNCLRISQAEGRHKCPYCAYEIGYEDGMRRAAETIRNLILKEFLTAASDEN